MKEAEDLEGVDLAGRSGDSEVLDEREREIAEQSIAQDDAVGIGDQCVNAAGDHVILDRRDVVDLGRDHAVETHRDVLAGKADKRLADENRRSAQRRQGSQTLEHLRIAANAAGLGQRLDPTDLYRAPRIELLNWLQTRVAELVLDRDVRRIIDQPPDEIMLRTLHQRRHREKERDPEYDARQRDEALAPACE